MLAAADRLDDGYLLTDLCRPRWLHNAATVLAGRPDRLRALPLDGVGDGQGARRPVRVADPARWRREAADAGRPRRPRPRHGRGAARSCGTRARKSIFVAGHVAVHPGGTAKVGDVVDTDLQTEIRGLYVGDASVIPMEWGLPPTFTVMALGRGLRAAARRQVGAPRTRAAGQDGP